MKIKHKFWLIGLLSLGLAIALLGNFSPPVAESKAKLPATELRGVWLTNIDSDVLYSRLSPGEVSWDETRLHGALKRLAHLNFNTIYPTIWNWGYTLYPSPVAAKVIGRALDPEPRLQGRDILAEMVQQGHQLGLSIIPWFEFGLMAPADSELARRHPEWITQRRNGTQIVKEGQDERVWLNPFHPQVQQFILELISEIVSDYEVDGLQFDDHFGLPVELGYDPLTVKLYQQEHQGKLPPNDPHAPEWMRWRANKITELMTDIFFAIKKSNPDCVVAIAPNPQDFSYTTFLQDWQTWERRGLVEELILQVYRNNLAAFTKELSQPEVQAARHHIPVSIGILTGLKNLSMPMQLIEKQVQATRAQGFAGAAFFFYETLGNRDPAFQALFPAPAKRPDLLQGWRPFN